MVYDRLEAIEAIAHNEMQLILQTSSSGVCWLGVDAVIHLAYEKIEILDSKRKQIVEYCIKNGAFHKINHLKEMLGFIQDYRGKIGSIEDIQNYILNIATEDNIIKGTDENADIRYKEMVTALRNYKNIVDSEEPGKEMLKVLLSGKETGTDIIVDKVATLRKLSSGEISQFIKWKLFIHMSNYTEDVSNIEVVGIDREWEFHKSTNFSFVTISRYGVTSDVIEKVMAFIDMYEEKAIEMGKYFNDVEEAVNEIRAVLGRANARITDKESVANGIKELYSMEAYKITDEALRRYKILKG